MKKYLFILFAIVLGTTATAQKKLYIYNLSSNDITVSDILTKHVTNAYPTFVDNIPDFTIPAITGSLELSNSTIPTYRFPFFSEVDNVSSWNRITSATTFTPNMSGGAATSTQINASQAQIFHCIKFDDGSASGVLGTTPLGSSEVVLLDTTGYYDEYVSGTLIEYTIIILDN